MNPRSWSMRKRLVLTFIWTFGDDDDSIQPSTIFDAIVCDSQIPYHKGTLNPNNSGFYILTFCDIVERTVLRKSESTSMQLNRVCNLVCYLASILTCAKLIPYISSHSIISNHRDVWRLWDTFWSICHLTGWMFARTVTNFRWSRLSISMHYSHSQCMMLWIPKVAWYNSFICSQLSV
jgi:hypothetical protein